jgi:predicted nucleic acid-binding protein
MNGYMNNYSTNVLRNQQISALRNNAGIVSVIVAGELLYGAYKSSRVTENLNTIYTLFDAMT